MSSCVLASALLYDVGELRAGLFCFFSPSLFFSNLPYTFAVREQRNLPIKYYCPIEHVFTSGSNVYTEIEEHSNTCCTITFNNQGRMSSTFFGFHAGYKALSISSGVPETPLPVSHVRKRREMKSSGLEFSASSSSERGLCVT
jgi:hypothetical protein